MIGMTGDGFEPHVPTPLIDFANAQPRFTVMAENIAASATTHNGSLEAAHEQLGRDFNKLEARIIGLVKLLANKDSRIAEMEAALRRRTPAQTFASKTETELLLRATRAKGDGVPR